VTPNRAKIKTVVMDKHIEADKLLRAGDVFGAEINYLVAHTTVTPLQSSVGLVCPAAPPDTSSTTCLYPRVPVSGHHSTVSR
jgi:hypothetical protein